MKVLFLDLETTGLDPKTCDILEIAFASVNLAGFEVEAYDTMCIHYPAQAKSLRNIHPKVEEMHTKNGLWHACLKLGEGTVTLADARERLSNFIVREGLQGAPLAGFNPSFDRGFLKHWMPDVEKLLHYRHFDATAFWLVRQAFDPDWEQPESKHRALADVLAAVKVAPETLEWFAS